MRAPDIHLKGKRVLPRSAVEHPLQWRVGNKTAIPVVFSLDFGSWETGRQRAAGDHMRRRDVVGRAVEVREIAGSHVHGADTEPHRASIEPIKIHQTFEGTL